MSPFEHGEVYVLEDGGEVDLDLGGWQSAKTAWALRWTESCRRGDAGNYERFMDITLTRDHNLTTGAAAG